ncbi:MAG: hypothetical protein IAI50_09285 [Candidatus Eremiobacteraeota bacterium]|nr:hypothetical protein [Candidatus Eremiobacteraeota bacterium]
MMFGTHSSQFVVITLTTILAAIFIRRGVREPPSRQQRLLLYGGFVVLIGAIVEIVLLGMSHARA